MLSVHKYYRAHGGEIQQRWFGVTQQSQSQRGVRDLRDGNPDLHSLARLQFRQMPLAGRDRSGTWSIKPDGSRGRAFREMHDVNPYMQNIPRRSVGDLFGDGVAHARPTEGYPA